ncbi:hypothetical protein E1212_02715 [Jiangella ureilytica]|uniref:Uncharacterized protein n=1 Tax=Jiangella ureilytica TaxID=2530374 RepID=A0A4R4RW25_9ACTN|nr:hypothetical protein E1212_02715 [Jiangella ureilytica]
MTSTLFDRPNREIKGIAGSHFRFVRRKQLKFKVCTNRRAAIGRIEWSQLGREDVTLNLKHTTLPLL